MLVALVLRSLSSVLRLSVAGGGLSIRCVGADCCNTVERLTDFTRAMVKPCSPLHRTPARDNPGERLGRVLLPGPLPNGRRAVELLFLCWGRVFCLTRKQDRP